MEEGAAEKLVDNKPIGSLFLISLRLLGEIGKEGIALIVSCANHGSDFHNWHRALYGSLRKSTPFGVCKHVGCGSYCERTR